jgi:imidazolonepropionase-like amidohydrolase
VADGLYEVRKATRQAIFMGADVIKVFATNISQGDSYLDYLRGDLTGVPAYSREELEIIAKEAHLAGLKVAAHAIGGPGVRWALEAGIDSIEHGNLIEEDDIEVFLRTGGFLSDPNLHLFFDPEQGFESPGNRTHKWEDLPEWWHQKVRLARERTRIVHGKALQAGVKIALATDLNHGNLWKEAKYFVECIGATEMQAIQAVTRNGAELCGMESEIGTLEKGKIADIISIKGNPLTDITDLRKVNLIMKEGEILNDVY